MSMEVIFSKLVYNLFTGFTTYLYRGYNPLILTSKYFFTVPSIEDSQIQDFGGPKKSPNGANHEDVTLIT